MLPPQTFLTGLSLNYFPPFYVSITSQVWRSYYYSHFQVFIKVQPVVVQLLSPVQVFATPWITAHQVFLSYTISWSLLKFISIESVMTSNHLILCCPLLLLPSFFSSIRVFSNESVLRIRWPKYWSFSLNFSPFNEYSGLISFRIDWFDFITVQGTLQSLLQHHTLKASILWHSATFMVQLSHLHLTLVQTHTITVIISSLRVKV